MSSTMIQPNKLSKVAMDVIAKCSELYGFKLDDAIEKILSSKGKKEVVKSSFVLPFSKLLNDRCCEGLRFNEGLYTQCEVSKKGDSKYCAVCEKGELKYGRMDERMKCGLMEFKDPSGKSPVAYSKIMKKLKLTKEDVLEEALKMGKSVDEVHFEVQDEKRGRPKVEKVKVVKEDKKKGRPKKEKKSLELESKTSNLFADLIANSCESEEEQVASLEEESKEELFAEFPEYKAHIDSKEEVTKKDLLNELRKTEKAVLKLQKEEEKVALKLQKDAEKVALKLEKDAEKEALKLQKDAEKEVKVVKVVKAKVVKEKAVKVVKEKAVKEPKEVKEKAVKEPKVVKEKAVKVAKEVPKEVPEEVEEEPDVVKKITFEGVKYLKSKNSGVVYNMEQDAIGKWDEEGQKIVFNPVEAELEADEEYESDDE